MKFEQSIQKLEEIVSQLERTDLSLDEAVACYEKGMRLAKTCTQELEKAQGKMLALQKQDDEWQEAPLPTDSEE